MRRHDYYVYILVSPTLTLYIGVTSDLEGRLYEHKQEVFKGFTKKYNVKKLVYYEHFGDIYEAIAREKQLKKWTRAKKLALIEKENPESRDIAANWVR